MIAIAFTCDPVHPGLTYWVILSRRYGTDRGGQPYPGLRPGLFSAVPSGLNLERIVFRAEHSATISDATAANVIFPHVPARFLLPKRAVSIASSANGWQGGRRTTGIVAIRIMSMNSQPGTYS